MTTTVKPAASAASASGSAPRRYPVSDQFFKDAIKEAIHESLFSPISLGEKHDVKLKPKFDTACWAYLPPHRIYIGTELFEKRIVKTGLSESGKKKYVANHYHHELGHALFTERDMSRIKRQLKVIEAPFGLYNLFEDAYMEDRYRREADYQFEWLTLEDLDFNPRPESLLFALIQAEGDVEVVERGLAAWKPEPPKVSPDDPLAVLSALFAPNPDDTRALLVDLLPKVVDYYRRITAVTQSMQLMPILKAWLDEFGRPPQMPPGGAGGGMSDLEMSAELMTDPAQLEEFEKDVDEIQASDKEGSPDGGMKGKAKGDDNHKAESAKGSVLHHMVTPVDVGRAERIAARLMKFFAEKTRVVSTRTPQRRISARHFVLDRAPYRRTEIEGRGRKKVFLEVDCSGSMGGFHIMEGKVLITALSMLARRGYVEGHIALSAVKGGPCWEVYKLPVAQSVIDRIQGYAGAEGLEYTMRDNLKLLQDADYVFVYTDAQICDRPIDKSFFHRYNVFTWGLYAGNRGDFLDEMMRYFDKAIMRESAEALVDAMLVQNK